MKKNHGFSLIELMVAITISASLIALITTSFSQQYGAFLFNNKKLQVNQDVRLAMQVVKKDVQNAGVFGNFSFHNQESGAYSESMDVGATCSSATWCNFDANTVGVKSYTSDVDAILSGFSSRLVSGSQILRVQLAGAGTAFFDPSDRHGAGCSSSSSCSIDNCTTNGIKYLNRAYFIDRGIESTYTNYMLTSANRAYSLQFNSTPFNSDLNLHSGELLVNFPFSAGCPTNGRISVAIESAVAGAAPMYNYIAYKPDMFTLTLTNLYTKYYFVLTASGTSPAGLYVSSLQSSGSMSTPTLVSASITNMQLDYAVDNNLSFNQATIATSRYRLCTTAQMNNSASTGCYNLWNKVTVVHITLSASGKATASDQINQEVSEAVGWKP